MRTTILVTAIIAAATLALAAPTAEAGKVKVNVNLGFASPGFGAAHGGHGHHHGHAPVVVAPYYAPQPVFATAPVVVAPRCAPVVYVPSYTYTYEQQWVAPVWQTQIIGYDHCGRAVTQQVCVAQGYYRTLRYRVYSNGAKVFDGYV